MQQSCPYRNFVISESMLTVYEGTWPSFGLVGIFFSIFFCIQFRNCPRLGSGVSSWEKNNYNNLKKAYTQEQQGRCEQQQRFEGFCETKNNSFKLTPFSESSQSLLRVFTEYGDICKNVLRRCSWWIIALTPILYTTTHKMHAYRSA